MNIILLNNFCKRKGSVELCVPRAFSLVLIGFFLVIGISAGTGYYFGQQQVAENVASAPPAVDVTRILDADRASLIEEKAEVQAHLDALAIRLGSLQAHMMRIDALGDRLVEVAKLDEAEFNFSAEPAMGGLDASENATSQDIDELLADVNAFNSMIEDRGQKLDVLEELIATGQLYEEITPSGRPIVKGWLSSRFGKRIDPKTGKKTFHRGYDYAGKTGADVIAVASGLVIRSEFQKGFGNMIELKHPEGYSTVYAHNKENLVKVGDVVKKGQQIALLGSTGRSTGPHVHFEVRRNGKYVNPTKFVSR